VPGCYRAPPPVMNKKLKISSGLSADGQLRDAH
jgi:hypothetical protein